MQLKEEEEGNSKLRKQLAVLKEQRKMVTFVLFSGRRRQNWVRVRWQN